MIHHFKENAEAALLTFLPRPEAENVDKQEKLTRGFKTFLNRTFMLCMYDHDNFAVPDPEFLNPETGSRNPDFLNRKISVPLPNGRQFISDISLKNHFLRSAIL